MTTHNVTTIVTSLRELPAAIECPAPATLMLSLHTSSFHIIAEAARTAHLDIDEYIKVAAYRCARVGLIP